MATPLNALQRKGVPFVWGEQQQETFEKLKETISQHPVLGMVNFKDKFVLQTDANGLALGTVLSQERNGVRLPNAHTSRTLTAHERKSSSKYELQCLAMLFGIDKFRKYLQHQEFILETDNQALSCLLAHPRQLGKIGRWVTRISAFKFEMRHIRGTQNIVADALSQMFKTLPREEQATHLCQVTLTTFPQIFQSLGQLQENDQYLGPIIAQLQKGDKISQYLLNKGILYDKSSKRGDYKVVVPPVARDTIYQFFHESTIGSHLVAYKTIRKIRADFLWKGTDKDIRDHVRNCQV
jgi:hypothetical protein